MAMIIVTEFFSLHFFRAARNGREALYPTVEPARSNGGIIDSASTKNNYADIAPPLAIAVET
jgi:hypothetical protein